MYEQKIHKAVPVPDQAEVASLLRTPADGVDRNQHINWDGADLAVRAVFEDEDGTKQPMHQIIVDYPSDKSDTGRFQQGFSLDTRAGFVATTSGGHEQGKTKLSDEQKKLLAELVRRSIDLG